MHKADPFRLLLLNPNTSARMTALAAAALRERLGSAVAVLEMTAPFGAPVVASRASFAVAAHAALMGYEAFSAPHDAVLLACFGDPGLEALREVASVKVIGLAETAILRAAAAGRKFAILTVGRPWVRMLEETVLLLGAQAHCVEVFALNGSGLDALRDQDAMAKKLNALAKDAAKAGAEAAILGGVALAGYAARLRPVLDYVDCLDAAAAAIQDEAVLHARVGTK